MDCVCPILGRVTEVSPVGAAPEPWQLVQCHETGFVFLLNPPSYEAVANEFAWQKTFADQRQTRRQQEPILYHVSHRLKSWRLSLFRRRDKLFALSTRHLAQQKKLSVLDVGSGRGHRMAKFCRNFRQRGIHVVPSGIEISAELAAISNAAFAPFGGSVVNDFAYEGVTKFPAAAFDMVVMSCYLEHESKPLEVLRRTRVILKPQGTILIKVPNYNCLNRRLRGRRWCGYRFPDHVNYFAPATLRMVAEQAGYEMQTQRWSDCLSTSDNMYAVLKKREGRIAESERAA